MDSSPTPVPAYPFVQLPTETIRDIFDHVKDQKDRIRLAQTCKRFKKYGVRDGTCLHALRGVVFNHVSNQVRTLRISPRGQTLSPSSWRHLSSVLAACIPLLPNLNDLSVHPALLDNLLLNNLLLSSIGYLRLNYPLTRRLFPLELLEGSLLPRSGSRPPVRIPCRFAIWITSKADATWANRVLRFLQHLGCKAKYFELLVVADLGSRSKLLFNHDFGLNALRVSTSPDFVLSLLPWMSDLQAAATFPTLRELSVNVRSPLKEGGYGRDEYDYPTLGE